MVRAALILILAVTSNNAVCQDRRSLSSVTFLVIDESGRAVEGWKVVSFKSNTYDAAPSFSGLTGLVPSGSYEYRLSAAPVRPGYVPTLGGRVFVERPEAFVVRIATADVRSGMAIDRALPATFVIEGRIEPLPAENTDQEPLRVEIHPLNPWSDIHAKVDPAGKFRIFQFPTGLCIVMVRRGAEILHVEPIYFAQDTHSSTLVLRLGDSPLKVRRIE